MLGRLLQIKIRHIIGVAIVLLVLEVISSFFYYHMAIKAAKSSAALVQLQMLNQARASLLYLQSQNSVDFQNYKTTLEEELAYNHIQLYFAKKSAQAYVIDAKVTNLQSNLLANLQNLLIAHNEIKIATFFPRDNVWAIFSTSLEANSHWQSSFIALCVHLLMMITLWTTFLLYYRYTLPKEVLSEIFEQGLPHPSKADTIISNLKQEIQAYYNEKNLMLAALAHDIKTPLTEALLRLELLENQTIVEPIKENLNMISNIITSSLDYAKAPEQIKKVEVEIISLLESIIENYQEPNFQVNLVTALTECELHIELQLFKRMMVNILDNAKKYATHCEILVNQLPNQGVEIICNDNGPGVPDALLNKLATPYFRVDKSRSSQTGGTGLGLAIVKKVVQLHKGKIVFKNRPASGFSVIITLFDDRNYAG